MLIFTRQTITWPAFQKQSCASHSPFSGRMVTLAFMILGSLCLVPALAAASEVSREKANAASGTAAPVVVDAAYLSKTAARIDALVNENLKKNNLKPTERITEETFIRRLYISLAGRIPTRKEAMAFFNDKSANRKARVIDQLLKSDGYKSSMFNWFGDMFRVREDVNGRSIIGEGGFFKQYLRDSLHANKPWDKMVYEMMAAEGSYAENWALGMLLKDAGMPLDSMTNTMTMFLGADISCAQCHDHPLNDWTQNDFYKMAAFFGTTDINFVRMVQFGKANYGINSLLLSSNLHHALPHVDKDEWLTYPADYAYKDAKPGDKVMPGFLVWDKKRTPAYVPVNHNEPDTLRHQFASWLTHPQNPRFAATIANRVWKKLFGLGVREPVTDLDDLESASNPALLSFLAEEMVRLKFDLRAFQGLLVSTELFQREAEERLDATVPFHFSGPLLRRMTAEQIFDSLMTVIVTDEIDRNGLQDDTARLKAMAVKQGKSYVVTESSLKDKPGIVKYDKSAMDALVARIKKEVPSNIYDKDFGNKDNNKEKKEARKGPAFPHANARASEMKQPQAESHLVRYLGQSPRFAPDDGSIEGGIAQVLNMMNGEMMNKYVCDPGRSFAISEAMAAGGKEEQIRWLYLSLLTRHPTPAQSQQVSAAMSKGLELKDVAWAIMNGREFIFIQ